MDPDEEFEKFLKESLTASDGFTPGRGSNKSSARLDWNVTSSEEVSPRKNYLKTTQELDEAEITPEKALPPPRNDLLAKINFLSSSLSETDKTATEDDRLEFANRLAQQNSALRSLGKNDFDAEVAVGGGTLEGLDEMKEAIEQEAKNDSKSESIFSDASKSALSESVASSSYSADTEVEESKVEESVNQSANQSVAESANEQDESVEAPESVNQSLSHSDAENQSLEEEESTEKDESKTNDSYNDSEFESSSDKMSSTARSLTPQNIMLATDLAPIEPIKPVPQIRISISTKDSTPEPPQEIANEENHDDDFEDNDDLEVVVETGGAKTDEIDRMFESSQHQVNALDLFDDNEADLSKTKDIALSESSLIETLKVYEQLQASRSIENEFEMHHDNHSPMKPGVTFKKPNPLETTTIKKKKPKKETTSNWSHVKSSGYGKNQQEKQQDTSRPKISPRLQAKVETVKRERIIAQRANEKLRQSANQTPTLPPLPQWQVSSGGVMGVMASIGTNHNDEMVDTLKCEIEHERNIRLQASYCSTNFCYLVILFFHQLTRH